MRLIAPALIGLLCLPALANDGRNRYEQGIPATVVHWHAPVSAQAGYRMLAEDMAGGADGDPAFRWVNRHALALTRLASRRTVEALGQAPLPYPVFDLTAENADTPLKIEADGPRGRHPGGSHDGGYNLDLGYYLTSETGKLETPDYAACTDHHKPAAPPATGLVEANICKGPADRLDVPRQTFFLLELVRVHRERFGAELLEAIGIDARVREAVLMQARAWAAAKRFGASAALVAEMDRLFASSPYEGWATSHHHHIHLRMRPLDPASRHGAALRDLVERDRALEARLLTAPDAEAGAAGQGCALLAELSSFALARSLTLRVASSGAAPCRVRPGSLRMRVIDGAVSGGWQAPRDPLDPLMHQVDAPATPAFRSVRAEAELQLANGQHLTLARTVALPAQPGWLRVRAEARDFVARTQRDGDALDVRLDFPPAHRVLVDKLTLLVRRQGGAQPEIVALRADDASARLPDAATIELIEAEIGLSRRVRWRVPVQP